MTDDQDTILLIKKLRARARKALKSGSDPFAVCDLLHEIDELANAWVACGRRWRRLGGTLWHRPNGPEGRGPLWWGNLQHTRWTMKTLERYIGGLVIGQGRHAGQPFKLLAWQRRLLSGAFKQTGDAAISMGRGCGKINIHRRDCLRGGGCGRPSGSAHGGMPCGRKFL